MKWLVIVVFHIYFPLPIMIKFRGSARFFVTNKNQAAEAIQVTLNDNETRKSEIKAWRNAAANDSTLLKV